MAKGTEFIEDYEQRALGYLNPAVGDGSVALALATLAQTAALTRIGDLLVEQLELQQRWYALQEVEVSIRRSEPGEFREG